METYRILLIEDNPLFRRGLLRFLASQETVEVVGELQNPLDVLSHIEMLKPHVLVTDLAMPGMSGIELIKKVVSAYPQVGCVVLTMHNTAEYREAVMEAGAQAFVSKSLLKTHLLPAIEEAHIATKKNV